ncbi:MAG: phosphoadenylyl-sulfate reductase [Bacteroidia bacterium]|jgi:phosphoadenosine phosphosulfate reductase|nr:phosphoadenylyl-sulfate reductase [Bacteroidia bacterium]
MNSYTTSQLAALNAQLGPLPVPERLRLLLAHTQGEARFSTSLGLEDQVLTHLIATENIPVRIFTIDTGRLFQETYDVLEITRTRYKIAVEIFFPQAQQVQEFVNAHGPNSFYNSVEQRKACCHIRKVEPLQRALHGASVWITGLRAAQSNARGALQFVAWDENHQLLKFNPLLDWTLEQTETFARQHRVPLNALHAKGFPSIGCAPCTRAVQPGEDIRAGRWWWENSHKECGLHSH